MRGWKLILLAVASVGGIAATQYDEYHYVKVYYSDATRTRGVGQETWYCDNRIEQTGAVTEYYRYYNGMCP